MLTDDSRMVLVGTGTADLVPVALPAALTDGTTVVALNAAVGLFWTGATARGKVFAFANSSAVVELNPNCPAILGVGRPRAVFFVATSLAHGAAGYQIAIISYSDPDASLYVGGAALNLPNVFCCATCAQCKNKYVNMFNLLPKAQVPKSWGLPLAALPLTKLDGTRIRLCVTPFLKLGCSCVHVCSGGVPLLFTLATVGSPFFAFIASPLCLNVDLACVL